MGLIALPQMLRLGYDQNLAIGTICASGSLGTMIPPSIVFDYLRADYGNLHPRAVSRGVYSGVHFGQLLYPLYYYQDEFESVTRALTRGERGRYDRA